MPQAYEGRPLDPNHGCPWCLAPPSALAENENGHVSCRLCLAVQPVDEMWYQTGDKIIDPRRASELFQVRWKELFT